MYKVAKALHLSPLSPTLSDLSQPQIAWLLLNVSRDEEEEFNKLKLLLGFINPEASAKLFKKDNIINEEVIESDEQTFWDDVSQHTKNNPEALKDLMEHPDTESNLDLIEPI